MSHPIRTNHLLAALLVVSACCLSLLGDAVAQPQQRKGKPAEATLPYQNPSLSPAERARDLLQRMTLEEKIGQMTQIATTEINSITNPKNKNDKFKPYLDPEKARKLIREHHIGSFLAAFAVSPQDWYTFSYELQKVNLATSRLGIPIIYGNDHVHGANYVSGATLFPQPLNLANTFNVSYAEAMGRITTLETAHLGQHWNFAPILDIGRNPYWPRQYESFGEDTWWAGTLGEAYIKSLQAQPAGMPCRVAATAKHFMGYSDPKTGWDRSPAVIAEQELREIFLPPFKKAIAAGVKTFMVNSGEVNGVPIHASAKFLNGMLRKELGFDGVIVTDWADILQLIGQHRVAHNEKEATLMALQAGIDMSMTATSTGFCTATKELVQEGFLAQQVVDDACYRILKLKFDLGLFENPYPSKDYYKLVGKKEHQDLAMEATRESLVLLKNDNLLPLAKATGKILVVGPAANSKRNLAGGWTINWGGGDEDQFPASMPTLFTALRTQYGANMVDTTAAKPDGTGVVNTAKLNDAALVVLALGEEPYAEGLGNIQDLNLPTSQRKMIEVVQATGKTHLIIMVAGRPRLLAPYQEKAKAIIHAGLPGEYGGTALAQLMAGGFNPSGKLSFTYPAEPGHLTPYNARVHERYTYGWSFGHGLSYTTFGYSNLVLSDSTLGRNGSITAKVTVTNTGKLKGKEAVLWFLQDEVRAKSTPLLRYLTNVEKIELAPGESRTLSFTIEPANHLAYPDEEGKQHLEAGYFNLHVGNLKKRFSLRNPGQGMNQADYKLKNYLQQDIGTE